MIRKLDRTRLVACVLLLASGCVFGGGGDPDSDNDSTNNGGTNAETNNSTNAPTNNSSNNATNASTNNSTPQPCVADTECSGDERCVGGACRNRCADVVCDMGENTCTADRLGVVQRQYTCNPDTGVCEPPDAPTEMACATNEACLQGVCEGIQIGCCNPNRDPFVLSIDPLMTFLRTDPRDHEFIQTPATVGLGSGFGICAGDVIRLRANGAWWGRVSPDTGMPQEDTRNETLHAIFAATAVFNGPGETRRIPGSVGAIDVPDVVTPPTNGGLETDIPHDFDIFPDRPFLVVPDDANYLYIGVKDSAYYDNEPVDGERPQVIIECIR